MRNLNYLDYYFKNLEVPVMEKLIGKFLKNPEMSLLAEDYYLKLDDKTKRFYEDDPFRREMLEVYKRKLREYFDDLNKELDKNKIAALFPPVVDIKTREDWHDILLRRRELIKTRKVDECNKYFGCESFNAYVPPKYEPQELKRENDSKKKEF